LDSRAVHKATFFGSGLFRFGRGRQFWSARATFHRIDHLSTPPARTEVKESIEPAQFNIKNFGQGMAKEDPWKDFFKSRQSLAPAIFQTEEIVVFSMPRIAKRFHASDKIPKQA
jgi:hypothetical protein